MGLTIHYQLSVVKYLRSAVVRDLAERTALYARKIGCEEVGEVKHVKADMKVKGSVKGSVLGMEYIALFMALSRLFVPAPVSFV